MKVRWFSLHFWIFGLQHDGTCSMLKRVGSWWFMCICSFILCSIHYIFYAKLHSTCSVSTTYLLNFVNSLSFLMNQIFSQIWETTPTNVKIGVELLQAVKEELELHPSRTSLDFLLSTCVKAKDSQLAWFVWAEYEAAGLSYNVLTFVRYATWYH